MNNVYSAIEPQRAEIDSLEGPAVIEFGTPWCGYCRAAQPLIAAAFANHPIIRHIKIEDGRGRPLGRSLGEALADADLSEPWQGNCAPDPAAQFRLD